MNRKASMPVVVAIFTLLGVSLTGCDSAKLTVSTSGQGVGSPSVSNSTTANFVMPSGLGLGEKSFSMAKGAQSIGSLSMISAADGAIEVYSDDASLVCSTDSFFNKNGEVAQGTRNCGGTAVAECTADGQVGCKTTDGFKAAKDPNPWDLRAGVTVGSTTGKLQVNCRNGATLATYDQGVPQTVTSIDTSTDVLTAAGHGYSDNQTVRISYNNIAPGGLPGYGTTYYIRESTADTFKLSTTSGGAAINITSSGTGPILVYAYKLNSGTVDIWDTIDDYEGWASAYPSSYSGWDATNLCGGIEAAPDDDNVWKDVTTTGDGVTASTCDADPDHCSFKDKISGLEWHKADSTERNWSAAQAHCDSLSYNGHTDWRLPTQKELLAAYHNGIASTAGATSWLSLSDIRNYYWSVSSDANDTNNSWFVSLANGYAYSDPKPNTFRVLCARL